MPSFELAEWRAYDRVCPLDSDMRIETAIAKLQRAFAGGAIETILPKWSELEDEVEAEKDLALRPDDPQGAVARIKSRLMNFRAPT